MRILADDIADVKYIHSYLYWPSFNVGYMAINNKAPFNDRNVRAAMAIS